MPSASLCRLPVQTSDFTEAICAYLAARAGETVTITEISSSMGLTPYEAARRFRRLTGRSLHRHLSTGAIGRLPCRACASTARSVRPQLTEFSEIAPA